MQQSPWLTGAIFWLKSRAGWRKCAGDPDARSGPVTVEVVSFAGTPSGAVKRLPAAAG